MVDESLGSAFLIAANYLKNKSKYLLITPNLYKAQELYSLLTSFVDANKVVLFPSDELIRAESVAENNELSAQRVFALESIIEGKADIVIASTSSAIRYLPDVDLFKSSSFTFKIGQQVNVKDIRKMFTSAGYRLVNKIDQSLQFAIRGDIVDIFSINQDYPIRIELFGDEIDSIRYFDIANQTSFEKISEVKILPASDLLLNEEQISKGIKYLQLGLEKQLETCSSESKDELSNNVNAVIEDLLNRNFSSRLYKYYSLINKDYKSIFDYTKLYKTILISPNSIKEEGKLLLFESTDYLFELFNQRQSLPGLSFYQDITKLINFDTSTCFKQFKEDFDDIEYNVTPITSGALKASDVSNVIHSYLTQGYKVICALTSNEHLNNLEELLLSEKLQFEKYKGFNIPDQCQIALNIASLINGVELSDEKIVILTEKELYNSKAKSYRYSSKYKEGTILKSYEDLNPGDYVVHEYKGIGQFEELVTLEVDNVHRDFLKIKYAKDEVLYVPLNQFQFVRKYMGKEGASPRLTKLHSSDWENTKKKIKERVNDLANRLYQLYKERAKVEGYAFPKDDEFQVMFENEFPYKLTKDQLTSVNEIKHDMEQPTPMDRLVCGDVGFGKTEVAFRAAFKAINSGKQVAILCPTTILASQHYQRACKRFASIEVRIAVYSRLVPMSQQKIYMDQILDGKINLVIGTHRLLSKDIVFDNLGLLIVDEEQRFGVEQKERLKELKENVDVLTLSATPIPRTLQISLVGMRSLSLINTAPNNRMPVQTYVMPFKKGIVKELIERELSRHGQVFYLHNRVDSLYSVASDLQKAIPSANIGVAHGQMDKNEIEDVMLKFYNNEINVLVCTSIVENGIDVPNANMIIVENADMYGLSQLYQIKGRVGRSDRIAYAYLLYNERKNLNDNAKKRLKAIKEFTALGSGYKIAQRDLMIRGAGDILGPDQAGFIDSIGLDMYIKLLNEAVKDRMELDKDVLNASNGSEIGEEYVNEGIELENIDAYIPLSYMNSSDKIELYQAIQNTTNFEELSKVKMDTRDIYGKLPQSVEYLFLKQELELLIQFSKIEKITMFPKFIEVILGQEFLAIKGIGNILFEAMIPFINYTKITFIGGVFKMNIKKRSTWLKDITDILKTLKSIVDKTK